MVKVFTGGMATQRGVATALGGVALGGVAMALNGVAIVVGVACGAGGVGGLGGGTWPRSGRTSGFSGTSG